MLVSPIHQTDPTPLGELVLTRDISADLETFIKDAIPLDPESSSYPEFFAEFVRPVTQSMGAHKILVLPHGTHLKGDLKLDFDAPWVAANRLSGLVCMGDLTVDGDIFNETLSFGPLLFVKGNLKLNNLVKAGAPVLVLGNVEADLIVLGHYNDGVLRVGGDLSADAYMLMDHDGYVRGKIKAKVFTDEDVIWREVLMDNVFENEREDEPKIDLIWNCARTRSKFLAG